MNLLVISIIADIVITIITWVILILILKALRLGVIYLRTLISIVREG